MPNFRIFTNSYIIIDKGRRVDENILIHGRWVRNSGGCTCTIMVLPRVVRQQDFATRMIQRGLTGIEHPEHL